MPLVFVDDIDDLTINNNNYRNVLYTTNDKNMQLVLMSLKPKEEIGLEIHPTVNQFFRIEKGKGKVFFGKTKNDTKERDIKADDAIIIPAGIWHNIINTSSKKSLKLYTIYTPANHPDQLKEKNKPENE